ncbi:MAG: DUF1854 domain-containing protein [Clostridia bacterium]|nr:DUF1854 domain-containing protein [Clostridia bacterium]
MPALTQEKKEKTAPATAEYSEKEIEEMFNKRESVPLTPQNAEFFRSEGGLISLKLKNDEGNEEIFERVVIIRAFPVSNPDDYISIREPSTKRRGNGSEIGMIRNINEFDKKTVSLLREELDRRYFTPEIKKIYSMKEKFGYSYCDALTSAGKITFVLNNPYSNIRTLENKSVLISDMDGNCFIIPDPDALDKASYKKIEIYL